MHSSSSSTAAMVVHGIATRGIDGQKRSVEIIASVGHDHKALGNPSDLARIVNRTFTSRLVDEVA